MATSVYLEIGRKRVFACAVEWPGWCRSGKSEEQAVEALAAYAGRYAVVAEEAGVRFPRRMLEAFEVAERVPGDATTDFGAPSATCRLDAEPLTAKAAQRLAALVEASWAALDRVVAASPAKLRKGPRGGGRDRDKMVEHVLNAEAAYARKIGVRHKAPPLDDVSAITAMRDGILAALRAPSDGRPVEAKRWPVRYAGRRIAWHVLDHAWEMEDRRE